MKLTLTKDRHDTLRLSVCSYNQSDTGLKIDIEPAADGEHPHLYVTIEKEDGEVYEGRLLLNGSGHVAHDAPAGRRPRYRNPGHGCQERRVRPRTAQKT